jgi:hypothetical protein
MSEEQMPALTARLQGWLDHVRACEASGQTMAEYAKAHGLPVKAFYDGRTRLIKRGVLRAKANGGHSNGCGWCRRSLGRWIAACISRTGFGWSSVWMSGC